MDWGVFLQSIAAAFAMAPLCYDKKTRRVARSSRLSSSLDAAPSTLRAYKRHEQTHSHSKP